MADQEERITLRDFYFAAALQGIVAARTVGPHRPSKAVDEDVQLAAYYADRAMMERDVSRPAPEPRGATNAEALDRTRHD